MVPRLKFGPIRLKFGPTGLKIEPAALPRNGLVGNSIGTVLARSCGVEEINEYSLEGIEGSGD